MSTTPEGWYPDPEQEGLQRYWDGQQWTEHRAPGATQSPPQPSAGGMSMGVKVTLGVLGGLLLIGGCAALLSGTDETPAASSSPTAADAGSTPEPAATTAQESPSPAEEVKLRGKITNVNVLNPATIAFTAIVRNSTDVPVTAQCFVQMQDSSGSYKGFDSFSPEGEIVKGAPTGFAGQLTITNEGAVWVTEQSIECEPR